MVELGKELLRQVIWSHTAIQAGPPRAACPGSYPGGF